MAAKNVNRSQPKEEKSDYVGIAGTVGAFSVALVALIVIFAKEWAWTIPLVVFCMCLLGIILGYYAKKQK